MMDHARLIYDVYYISGVRITRNNSDVDLFARRIISDAGVINTYKYLLPQEVAVKARK